MIKQLNSIGVEYTTEINKPGESKYCSFANNLQKEKKKENKLMTICKQLTSQQTNNTVATYLVKAFVLSWSGTVCSDNTSSNNSQYFSDMFVL